MDYLKTMSNVSDANQHTKDEREQKCWDFYIEGITNGIENALQAALKAGYSKDHARNITLQGWFKERKDKLIRKDMLSKAEKVLDTTLSYDPLDEQGKPKVDLIKVQTDVAKHITKTLGKDNYSERNEHTGSGGEPLSIIITSFKDEDKDTA